MPERPPTTETAPGTPQPPTLTATRVGIDTHDEPIIYMRADCPVCRSEGFSALSRVRLRSNGRTIIATLNVVTSDILTVDQVGLSDVAWRLLGATEGEKVRLSHPNPLQSMTHVRSKIYGHRLEHHAWDAIIRDIAAGRYSTPQIAAFVTACAGDRMDLDEISALTRAMVDVGRHLSWERPLVVDKHSVGGLPGNRTTPIVVSIIASLGLTMPKTSSRAITSPAGTADTMETLTPVDLDLETMRRVVHEEGGCFIWGGNVRLSPADDIIIRTERALDIDSEGQMIASVLSKKKAAGSTHVVIDMPVGPTAKVRDEGAARTLSHMFQAVGKRIGLQVTVQVADGTRPVGRGIGPALEARDVLAVLRRTQDAPEDLAERAVTLAGALLEMATHSPPGEGRVQAQAALDEGDAWNKFQRICRAQGGLREPPVATYREPVYSQVEGKVVAIDNRRLARVAKLAGAPADPAAGLLLHNNVGADVAKGDILFVVHAQSRGELDYALRYLEDQPSIFDIAKGGA